jgi:hypothetical protein
VALFRDQTSCINRCSNGPSRGLELIPKIENDFVIRKRGKTCAVRPKRIHHPLRFGRMAVWTQE